MDICTVLQFTNDDLFAFEQEFVGTLHLVRWIDQERTNEIGTVGFIPNAKGAHDGRATIVKWTLVTSVGNTHRRPCSSPAMEDLHRRTEFEIVVATTLNNRWITHLNEIAIDFGNVFLFVQSRFEAFGQFRMFHFLSEQDGRYNCPRPRHDHTRSESTMLMI